jgi:hypothetical protein
MCFVPHTFHLQATYLPVETEEYALSHLLNRSRITQTRLLRARGHPNQKGDVRLC